MANNIKSLGADKLENPSATQHNNYWSPLACLVKEQEEIDDDHPHVDHLLAIVTEKNETNSKKQDHRKMEKKSSKPVRHLGHGLHIGCRSRNGHGLFP